MFQFKVQEERLADNINTIHQIFQEMQAAGTLTIGYSYGDVFLALEEVREYLFDVAGEVK